MLVSDNGPVEHGVDEYEHHTHYADDNADFSHILGFDDSGGHGNGIGGRGDGERHRQAARHGNHNAGYEQIETVTHDTGGVQTDDKRHQQSCSYGI